MKPFKHVLTTALVITSATPFARTTVAPASSTRQPAAVSPTAVWHRLIPERFTDSGDYALTHYPRRLTGQAVISHSPSSDPAWLWVWALAQGIGWIL